MFHRRSNAKLAFDCRGIRVILAALAIFAAASSGRVVNDEADPEIFVADAIDSVSNEPNEIRRQVQGEGEFSIDTGTVVEAMRREFGYPVKTRLESANTEAKRSDAAATRFRRDDEATVTHDRNAAMKDYMSTYYAQRKAIMEKYRSQQNEIRRRLKKTKGRIAVSEKLEESKKINSDAINATRDQPPPDVVSPADVTPRCGDGDSTIPPDPTSSGVDFDRTAGNADPPVATSDSTIFNDARGTSPNVGEPSSEPGEDETTGNPTEADLPAATLSPIYEILSPSSVDSDEIDVTLESVNTFPRNEVDFNLTEQTLVRQERDNDTLVVDLGNNRTDPSIKNNSALEQLEKMFYWDEAGAPKQIDRDSTVENVDDVSADGRPENSSRSSDSLRFTVEIKSSPEVGLTSDIKSSRTSTTVYRNLTHEIVEIDGVVNSTKRIDDVPPVVDPPDSSNADPASANVTTPEAEIGGGARESEWCEECPHDYRWGSCGGTLFYQHNVFLRNRGPSAIDAIFGMNVQGPVDITCVEAIRFNKTRGIVTLHSGGPGNDFAKLRIRGFQGEGFSYIMKVWGVGSERSTDSGTARP